MSEHLTAQNIATAAVILLVVAMVVCGAVGRSILARDPNSKLGRRLIGIGSDLRALGKHPAVVLLPPAAREILQSIPDEDEDTKPGAPRVTH